MKEECWKDWDNVIKICDIKFNSFVGNTLELIIQDKWDIDGFNAVIGNPPYNNKQNNKGKKGGGDHLWNKFVVISLNDWLLSDGYLVYVHPPSWRKPESKNSKTKGLFKLMVEDNFMEYLEIHDLNDGKNVFNAGTRYDWYVIKNSKPTNHTNIRDEKGILHKIDLTKWEFLPNYNFDVISSMLTKTDDLVPIIYSASNYESRNKHVSSKEDSIFKYKLVHTTPKKGHRYFWSSDNDKVDKDGENKMFGVKKVIFGDSGINDAIIDIDGVLGMTQHSMAIEIKNMEEGTKIKTTIESEKFQEVLKSLSYSNFQIDWRIFKYFRRDFWKGFI
jgi:hypothetical protein